MILPPSIGTERPRASKTSLSEAVSFAVCTKVSLWRPIGAGIDLANKEAVRRALEGE